MMLLLLSITKSNTRCSVFIIAARSSRRRPTRHGFDRCSTAYYHRGTDECTLLRTPEAAASLYAVLVCFPRVSHATPFVFVVVGLSMRLPPWLNWVIVSSLSKEWLDVEYGAARRGHGNVPTRSLLTFLLPFLEKETAPTAFGMATIVCNDVCLLGNSWTSA